MHRQFLAGRQKSLVSMPSFREGDFFFLLHGAELAMRLSVLTLNPTHPVRLTDHGGAASYWLGVAKLKAGGSCPMRCDDHRRKQPLASRSAPIEQETYNR